MGVLKDYILRSITETVKKGGKLVTDEHYKERLKVCDGCEFNGTVSVAQIKTDGCEQCECPFATKAKMWDYPTLKGQKKTTCPHPDGNKWEDVDASFEDNY